MKLYLAVTADKYELPFYVAETAVELAKVLGTSSHVVYSSIQRGYKRRDGLKLIKIEVENE